MSLQPFATDLDLATWEPALFAAPIPAAQRRLWKTAATIAGSTLTIANSLSAAGITPGMVATLTQSTTTGTGTTAVTTTDTILCEIISIPTDTTATLSALRARATDVPIPPSLTGTVTLTVVSYAPLIDAIGDSLLNALHLPSDFSTSPTPAPEHLWGFRAAAVFGTLAAAYRSIEPSTPASTAKITIYDKLHQLARKVISAMLDTNNDGIPDLHLAAGNTTLHRA